MTRPSAHRLVEQRQRAWTTVNVRGVLPPGVDFAPLSAASVVVEDNRFAPPIATSSACPLLLFENSTSFGKLTLYPALPMGDCM